MQTPKIFNPKGSDKKEDRLIWHGNSSGIIQLNEVKYNWAVALYNQMRENFWIPSRTDLTGDLNDYLSLSKPEEKAFKGTLSYLTFLDSIQVSNIGNFKRQITAPEIKLCLTEQESQEGMHSITYQYIIESLIPPDERNDVYSFWKKDKILRERCEFIAQFYQNYIDTNSEEDYFKALVANYVLESIYFYNGFSLFYTLASRKLLQGVSSLIVLINRDELSHVRLYQKLLFEAINNKQLKLPNNWETYITDLFLSAIEQESLWVNHIMNDSILGITPESTKQYTMYLADLRLRAIGLNGLNGLNTENLINPYKHLEEISNLTKINIKENFFESNVTSYTMSTSVKEWDF